MINYPFLTFLGTVSALTILFSMFNNPGIRGFRNFGFLAVYIGAVVGLFVIGWKAALLGWAVFAVASGVLYYAYELYSAAKHDGEPGDRPSPTTILHGFIAWPIMLPEAIEYLLADLGVLKARDSHPAEHNGSHD